MIKRPDLASINALLADLQEQVSILNDLGNQIDAVDLELLDATAQFMAANVSVYRKTFIASLDEEDVPAAPIHAAVTAHVVAPEVPTTEEEAPAPYFTFEHEEEMAEELVDDVEEEEPNREMIFDLEDEIVIDQTDTIEVAKKDEEIAVNYIEEEEWEMNEDALEEELDDIVEVEDDTEFATRPLSINEILANQMKEGAYSRPVSPNINDQNRITNLKTAISLNDKLLFIKELFNGYSLAYSEAIELLNRYSSFDEADDFLKSNYAVKNQWDAKPETVNKLYSILRNRYNA